MTEDQAEGIILDFIMAVVDAERFVLNRAYRQHEKEFRERMIAALQFAPYSIFGGGEG